MKLPAHVWVNIQTSVVSFIVCLFKFSFYCFKMFTFVLTHIGLKLPQNLWGWWNIVIVNLLLHIILYWSCHFSGGNPSLCYLQFSRQSAVVQHPQALMRFLSQSETVAHVWRTLCGTAGTLSIYSCCRNEWKTSVNTFISQTLQVWNTSQWETDHIKVFPLENFITVSWCGGGAVTVWESPPKRT